MEGAGGVLGVMGGSLDAGGPGAPPRQPAPVGAPPAAFIRVVGSEFVQKYLGEGPRMVRDVFRLAKENAPAIIFIDEIDAIATKRFDAQTGGEVTPRGVLEAWVGSRNLLESSMVGSETPCWSLGLPWWSLGPGWRSGTLWTFLCWGSSTSWFSGDSRDPLETPTGGLRDLLVLPGLAVGGTQVTSAPPPICGARSGGC